jgi:hypothetical protein
VGGGGAEGFNEGPRSTGCQEGQGRARKSKEGQGRARKGRDTAPGCIVGRDRGTKGPGQDPGG